MTNSVLKNGLPKAVFFDLDGTLVDSVPDLAAAVDGMLVDLGYAPAGVDKVRLWVGNGARMLVLRAIADAQSIAENAVPPAQLDTAHQGFLTHYQRTSGQHSCLYAGVKDALASLQQMGVTLVVITNKPAQFTPTVLAEQGIDGFFSLVISGDTLAERKPHPAQLLHAMSQLELDATECVMVGDSRNDIEAAVAAGVPSICVTYGYNHGDDVRGLPADGFTDDFSEIVSMIGGH